MRVYPGVVEDQEIVCEVVPLGHTSLNDSPPLFKTLHPEPVSAENTLYSSGEIVREDPTKFV